MFVCLKYTELCLSIFGLIPVAHPVLHYIGSRKDQKCDFSTNILL